MTTTDVIVAPNLFDLTGKELAVTLAQSGIDGKPHFTYQDEHQSLTFSGDEITFEETQLGSLATVVIIRTVDLGDTTFTLLVPRMNLVGGNHHIDTVGITALHRTSIAGIGHGQLTSYHTTRLRGTASQVEF